MEIRVVSLSPSILGILSEKIWTSVFVRSLLLYVIHGARAKNNFMYRNNKK
ncbi:unnamed protein product [Nesidiocoris tenuis]|uniref:Uncharacterized protein n=1 Tax=Nesidiocoris tenuis TaxID=355587 RepID=A0A6H5HTL7_9HEMI|nr:unnamed protein product [Nesidiocoris tenuis]